MPSDLLLRMYAGDRSGAQAIARMRDIDLFEAAALGALEALIERAEEDPRAVTAVNDDGWTPLHLAAFFGHTACVKDLLRRGAGVDTRSTNRAGGTALHSACAGDHADVANVLIGAGADVNAEQRDGFRPLDRALVNGNLRLAASLRRAGARSRADAADPP